ncbi:MAG: hypothetical protein ACKV0T_31915 [Planctomycetales bacterium]
MHDPQKHNRREFLIASAAASTSVLWNRHDRAHESEDENRKFALHAWERDPRNPIFVPRSEFDASGAQGPFVVRHDGQWWMFYAGIGKDGLQRIRLATANPKQPTEWERHGPILELGAKDAFDERSATYPCVHRIGGKWHLYYSGRSNREG